MEASRRVPALGLQQVIALMAGDFAVQVVALVAEQFMLVELQAEQMTAAIGQPTDAMAVRADGRDAVVERVVLVLPDGNQWLFQTRVMLVLAQQIACRDRETIAAC